MIPATKTQMNEPAPFRKRFACFSWVFSAIVLDSPMLFVLFDVDAKPLEQKRGPMEWSP